MAMLAACVAVAAPAIAGDRLLATGGAQQLEGAAGGGIVPWALIAGYGTNRQIGGSAFATRVNAEDFELTSVGAAVGIFNRVELSYAKQSLDAGSVIPGLKLRMDVAGAKVRVLGDAVYDQDRWYPQLAVGVMHKRNTDMEIPSALGAKKGSDTEVYVAATRLWLGGLYGYNVLGNLTLRSTRANQMGLLGFGGDRQGSRRIEPEVSLAVMATDQLAVGMEYRRKPDNLGAFREEGFRDVFVAWFPHRNVALTAAIAKLGTLAGKPPQDAFYLSLQLTL